MAGGTATALFPSPLVSHRRHRALPLFSTPPFLSSGRRRSPSCKPRPRTTSLSVKFSRRANPVSSESPEAKPKPAGNDRDPELSSTPPAGASPSPFLGFITHGVLCQIWGDWRADRILLEIASIALPAMLALAADPLTSVVDTAFVGHLGSVELAAVGVSISVFNLVSKLFNVPLLNITTSFVAEEQASASDNERSSSSSWHDKRNQGLGLEPFIQKRGTDGVTCSKRLLPAVSTSLVMAAGIGIAEAFALSFGSGKLMDFMGIFVDSPMRIPAVQFLTVRALGAPAIVIALAAQGTFRGFKDTKTPLYAIGAGNLLNAILDPILMFLFALGVEGAAIATVIADYLIAFVLLWKLNEEVVLIPSNIDSEKLLCYLNSGGLLIGRTFAVLGTMTLSTSLAAQQGPIPMAAHQICLQVWLAISLLNDALALAGQALLASEFAKGNYKKAQTIIYRVLQIGFITGLGLAVVLLFAYEAFCGLFTTDSAVLEIAQSGLLFVTASQPINALAFVIDGLYYGVSDFAYAAYSMVLVGLFSSLLLLTAAPLFGLSGVWIGLFVFMTLRVAAGFWRLGCKTGPWQMIWSGMDGGVADE